MTPPLTLAERLEWLMAELEQVGVDAEDCNRPAVAHKVQDALGLLRNARAASQQYDTGVLAE